MDEELMGMLPIIVFGLSSPARQACDFASAGNANGFSAVVSGSPQCPARLLDGVLTVSFDPSNSSDQAIAGAADASSRSVEVQQAGINPMVLGGSEMLVAVILIIGYKAIIELRTRRDLPQFEKLMTLKKELTEKEDQFLKRQEAFFDKVQASKEEEQRRRDAARLREISEMCAAVDCIKLGIFPIDDREYALGIFMDAPLSRTNLFISSFPPRLDDLKNDLNFNDDVMSEIREAFSKVDPLECWNRGECPSIGINQMNFNISKFSREYQKHQKTLSVPPGMAVYDYAVAIVQESDRCAERTFSLSADERAQGVVCYSNRLLSTILQGAGGVTAGKNMSDFRQELQLVSKVSNTQSSESITVPGLGVPLSSPSQAQKPDDGSPERKSRGFFGKPFRR
ncbi:MAG TPA: hypothetical protein VGZ00_09130 [Candidatus Baltobacteraceae bacterium]|jgi:hypothetical protein|nr:hypothetical protein [Candidatus Baltobacteraceae bacterium]